MRIRKLMAVLALSAACSSVSAQKETTTSIKYVDVSEWQSFYVQYNSMSLEYSINVEAPLYDGVTVGYSKAFNVGKTTPLFIEAGISGQVGFYTNDDLSNWDYKYSLFSAKVPVNLVYKWTISNNIAILPYIGVIGKYHIVGNMKKEYTGSGTYVGDDDGKSYDLFDKKDMGEKNKTWKRFQLGYQLGINVMFNKTWHLGLSYSKDFSEVVKKAKFGTISVTIGLNLK